MTDTQTSEAKLPPMQQQVHCLIPHEQLVARVRDMAREISETSAGPYLRVIGVLQGAFVFMADLLRHMTIPSRCGFIMVSSYGDRTTSTGQVRLHLDLTHPVEGEHILLVDDIVDTGITTNWLLAHLQQKRPASIKVCTLLDKPARRRVPVKIDYLGFEIPDRFVVGYGVDYAGWYRNLPYIGYLDNE